MLSLFEITHWSRAASGAFPDLPRALNLPARHHIYVTVSIPQIWDEHLEHDGWNPWGI